MKIDEMSWNFFRVPIEKKQEESKKEYLEKVAKCLDKFYETYTTYKEPIRSQIKRYFGPPENLPMEHNFCEMSLDGINYCDVKYFVQLKDRGPRLAGIDICCHRDREEWRKPMVNFLKEKWKEFEFPQV